MSISDSRHELESALQTIRFRLADCEKRLARGDLRSRVQSMGELEFLKAQQQALKERLDKVGSHPEGIWATVKAWFQMETALLEERIGEWTTRHDHETRPG